jgi:hypothetical protein
MIRHLHPVSGLEPLEKIARELGIVISGTGDLARRLYSHELLTPSLPAPDLFELTPFTTCIELVHSGGAEVNDALRRAIMRELILPECFRWRIWSAEQDQRHRRASSYGPVVPVHDVRLSTHDGFDDPMNARGDIVAKTYRYVRNPLYRESPRFLANRDLEVFGAIGFLRTVIEAELSFGEGDATLLSLRDTFRDAMSWDTVARLQQSAALRARLHRIVREVRVAARTIAGRELIDRSEIAFFLSYVDGDGRTPMSLAARPAATRAHVDSASESGRPPHARFLDDLELDERHALTVSDRIRGDLTRLPQHIELLTPDALATGVAGQILQVVSHPSALADGIEMLRMSNWVRLTPGSRRARPDGASEPNEMIHFAYIDSGAAGAAAVATTAPADEDVSAVVLLRRDDDRHDVLVAGPLATCTSHAYEMPNTSSGRLVTLRLACGSAIERIVGAGDGAATHVAFMVAARRIEEPPPESEASVPVTTAGHEEATSSASLTMSPLRYKTQVGDPVVDPREGSTS